MVELGEGAEAGVGGVGEVDDFVNGGAGFVFLETVATPGLH